MNIWEILAVVLATVIVLCVGWSLGRTDRVPNKTDEDKRKEELRDRRT